VTTSSVVSHAPSDLEVRRVQRRTLGVLVLTQMIGGVGVAIGITVGALLAKDMGGTEISGLAQSSLVVGAALLALPVTRLMLARGRRPGLALAYALGSLGAALIVVAAASRSLPLLFVGLFLFGGGSAANYQARYTALDLAEPSKRGRQLSFVVWATTIGSVAGPNLAPLADPTLRRFGAVTNSGPFAYSALAFAAASLVVLVLLRPDPLRLARSLAPDPDPGPGAGVVWTDERRERSDQSEEGRPRSKGPGARASGASAKGQGVLAALREVSASPPARLGMASVAMGHLVMIAVMAMTPIHIGEAGHPDELRIVGIVLSLHIAGMYALSPVTGWLTDRAGRRPVILGGIALLVIACAVAGTAGHDTVRLSVGLFLLGLGWSATMVAGSTLLSESVGVANKPAVQGLSDLVMGLAGASSGALSGLVMAWSSYSALAALAAVAVIPVIALAIRPTRVAPAPGA
jgi:MFS family permease